MNIPYIKDPTFEWDEDKNLSNLEKHNVGFEKALNAFLDKNRVILTDAKHSSDTEKRYYCVGKINNEICTVRFVVRDQVIRIIGAAYWRKERKIYEKINQK
jgi:uncharacterized DUF497 family protein